MAKDLQALTMAEPPVQVTEEPAPSVLPSSLICEAVARLSTIREVYLQEIREAGLSLSVVKHSRYGVTGE